VQLLPQLLVAGSLQRFQQQAALRPVSCRQLCPCQRHHLLLAALLQQRGRQ